MHTARFDFPVLADSDIPHLLDLAARIRGVLAVAVEGATLEALVQSAQAKDELEAALRTIHLAHA